LLVEGLLVPFHINGQAVGTVWVIAHDETRKFDAEDQRLLESLATFAATAYEALLSMTAQAKANQDLIAEIAERQRAEEALREAHRRKTQFLAMLAHELRNPLAPIRNAVEMLRRSGGDEQKMKPVTENGYEAARRIREQQRHKDLTLVALTGFGQDKDRRRAEEAGFDAHMVKPVDFAALAKLLAASSAS
jgi:signal transduction histidine kinase